MPVRTRRRTRTASARRQRRPAPACGLQPAAGRTSLGCHAARTRALCDAARTHAVCALRSCVLWPDPNATSVGAWLSDECKLVNLTRAEALCVCTELGLVALNFTGKV